MKVKLKNLECVNFYFIACSIDNIARGTGLEAEILTRTLCVPVNFNYNYFIHTGQADARASAKGLYCTALILV